jgi:hypothetical protein
MTEQIDNLPQLQGVAHDISEDARKAIQRARKILDMASRPPSDSDTPAQIEAKKAEAAVAAEKFQAVLLEYNLTQAMVEQAGGETDGRREEAKLKAGVYEWQRNLWEAVAELNFCLYFCMDVWRETEYMRKLWDGTKARRTRFTRGKEHRVIGRIVNTHATINLCTYIEAAIEQATREKLVEVVGSTDKVAITRMLFSRYAVSFREGAADDVIRRVNDQRAEVLREERELAKEAQKRADAAAASGVSDSTALVLASFIQTEGDLNRDHARGKEPGTTARERAERAAARAAEEAAHTAWAAANPEEAAAKAKEEREENERYWRRRNANYRGGPAPKERDNRAYRQGSDAGSKIGLDIQAGGRKTRGALS